MSGVKAGRMSEDIRRIISAKMRDLKDPRLGGGSMLTVIRCDVSGDGSFCKVYISSLEGFDKAKEAVKGLTKCVRISEKRNIKRIEIEKMP